MKILLHQEYWDYVCGDGCCHDWGTDVTFENTETNQKLDIGTLDYLDLTTALISLLEFAFPKTDITDDFVELPDLSGIQLIDFTEQFRKYDSTIEQKDGIHNELYLSFLASGRIHIVHYGNESTHENILVINNQYYISVPECKFYEFDMLDTLVDIAKYSNIELIVEDE